MKDQVRRDIHTGSEATSVARVAAQYGVHVHTICFGRADPGDVDREGEFAGASR